MNRLVICALLAAISQLTFAIEHPFILWNAQDAALIRAQIEKEPWAKAKYEQMLADKSFSQPLRNLFKFQIMGDEKAGEAEKKYLLGIIGTHPQKYEKVLDQGGRHYDCYMDVLRYDVLYGRLSADERRQIEETFRVYIDYQLADKKVYTRTSWLPNMQWPRPLAAHLMALVMGDRELIGKLIVGPAGWKWYFDHYIADGRFYMEEFGKHYSMIGEMFLFCRGLERLGMNDIGYGYRGAGGASMRSYVESIVEVGWPRTEIPGGMARFEKVTMGDAKGNHGSEGFPPYLFQHAMVGGFLPGGSGGDRLFSSNNMNGRDHKNAKVDKLATPLWFELAHQKWPDAGFDYFLAQMRKPTEDRYYPSLLLGLSPIDPAKVSPPAARSYLAPERGFAMLRAAEGPEYWQSPAPATALQLSTYYVHYVHDSFSLLGLHAFNRPIYLNRGISNGYAGGDPWSDSTRGHCGVTVDNLQWWIDPNDPKRDHPHWPNPIGPVPTRFSATPLVKFVAARGRPLHDKAGIDDLQPLGQATLSVDPKDRQDAKREIWPGVEPSRGLFLTGEYLFDVYTLRSDRPRKYEWAVHALGLPQPDGGAGWAASDELRGRLYEENRQTQKRFEDPEERARYELGNVHRLAAGARDWSFTAVQSCGLDDPARSVMGQAWYERKVGVKVWMLGEEGTTAYYGKTPEVRKKPGAEKSKGEKSDLPNEVGGTTLIVQRNKPSTVFVAVHEPIENATSRIAEVRRVGQTEQAIGVAVMGREGSGIDDRLLLSQTWDDQPVTLEGDGESFTFSDYAYVRITAGQVRVSGHLRAMRLKVAGQPKLIINDKETAATCNNGLLTFGRR